MRESSQKSPKPQTPRVSVTWRVDDFIKWADGIMPLLHEALDSVDDHAQGCGSLLKINDSQRRLLEDAPSAVWWRLKGLWPDDRRDTIRNAVEEAVLAILSWQPSPDVVYTAEQAHRDQETLRKAFDLLQQTTQDVIHDAQPSNGDKGDSSPGSSQPPDTGHSADFHSVRWYGQEYTFTHQQAAIVKLLWEAWGNGTPDLGKDYLLEESESASSRLRDIFKGKDGMHPAWNAMIVESKKGVFRLASPQTII